MHPTNRKGLHPQMAQIHADYFSPLCENLRQLRTKFVKGIFAGLLVLRHVWLKFLNYLKSNEGFRHFAEFVHDFLAKAPWLKSYSQVIHNFLAIPLP